MEREGIGENWAGEGRGVQFRPLRNPGYAIDYISAKNTQWQQTEWFNCLLPLQ